MATPRREMAKSIEAFSRDFGNRTWLGYVIHPGDTLVPLGASTLAQPFAML